MEHKRRIPLRSNALLIVAIAAAPVIAGSMAVVDKLCSPEPTREERTPPSDEHYAFVERLFDKALAWASIQSAEADIHKQGSRA